MVDHNERPKSAEDRLRFIMRLSAIVGRMPEPPMKREEVLAFLGKAKARSTRNHAAALLAYHHSIESASGVCGIKLVDLDRRRAR